MADDFELPGVHTRRQGVAVGCKNIFQALSRPEVAEFFSWIQHSAHTQEMTLLANAVASVGLQLGGVDDCARPGFAEVLFRRAVTALAGNCLCGKRRRPIQVRRSCDM